MYAAAVLRGGGHIYWEWPAKCIGWSSVELREFRAQQKCCGRELFMTACDSCFFARRENNLLEHHRWQFLTSDPRFKEYMSLQCQGNHEHVWKQTSEGKREHPVAMIRRLVNGFVHDLRPPQLHMFLSEADLEDYTNKFIIEAPVTRERSRQRQESMTAQELSMLRGVLGELSKCLLSFFLLDVSLPLSATAHPVVQDLLDANKLVSRYASQFCTDSSFSLFQ